MHGYLRLLGRAVLQVSGADRVLFLDRLVSNSVSEENVTYALFLTPQGKYLHDFFIHPLTDSLLLDCEASRAADLLQRLKKYVLRSQVDIKDVTANYSIIAAWGMALGAADPRHKDMGKRLIKLNSETTELMLPELAFTQYQQQRLICLLPDSSNDIEPERGLPLEHNLDLANAISFSKGCYIGQELTARMRYRELIKKRLGLFQVEGPLPPKGAPIFCGDKQVGEVRTGQNSQFLGSIYLEYKDQLLRVNNLPLTLLRFPPP